MKINEMKVEVTIPTVQFGNQKISVVATLSPEDNAYAVREELINLCEGNLVLSFIEDTKTPIEAYIEQVDAESAKVVEAVGQPEAIVEVKKTRKTKVKLVSYDRNLEIHKKLFSNALTEVFPEWKKEAAKAKAASMLLEKEDFLSESGEVVDTFKTKLLKAMSV